MIRAWRSGRQRCDSPDVCAATWTLEPDTVWLDLVDPGREEELAIERALGMSLPTREEMAEIEASSRLYREDGGVFMTANVLYNSDAEIPASGPVTFVLTRGPLVTIRYFDPRPFKLLTDKLERDPDLCADGPTVFLNLMEAVIDRTADVLEKKALEADELSARIFGDDRTRGFEHLLTRLGRLQAANARIEESLSGLSRVFAFAGLDERLKATPAAREHLRSLSRDAQSLISHAHSVAANISFQLSAALGLINIEQSSIIKIFSVAAVAFLPPTLIASVYGMNFDFMPELASPWGYPAALVAMVVSAVAPLVWFHKKGWL